MNRSSIPLTALCLSLPLAGCDPLVTSAAEESRRGPVILAERSWRMDFESGLPALRMEANSQSFQLSANLNERLPISGTRDLRVSAILRGSEAPGWAAVWLPLAGSKMMDARRAIGFRLKVRSSVARQYTLMLDSDVYPSEAIRYATTLDLAATTSEYAVYFSQFAYPQRLMEPGGICSIEAAATVNCQTSIQQVLSRLRALQGFLVPRSNAKGVVPSDTVTIQIDDLQLLFDEDLIL